MKNIYVVDEDYFVGRYVVRKAVLLKDNSNKRDAYTLTNYEIRYTTDKKGTYRGYNIIFNSEEDAVAYRNRLYRNDIQKTIERLERLIEAV